MRTFQRICIEDAEVRAQNGDCQQIKRGEEYITSDVRADGTVVVFSRFWVPFPERLFAGAVVFTKQ